MDSGGSWAEEDLFQYLTSFKLDMLLGVEHMGLIYKLLISSGLYWPLLL